MSVSTDACWDNLTPAELRVVRLVAEGMANKDIARALHLSRFTVETHLKHVFVKLDLSSRAALAVHVVRREMHPRGSGGRGVGASRTALMAIGDEP